MNRALRKELAVLAGLASAGCWLLRQKTWAAALGACAAGLAVMPSTPYSFAGRTVIITGGSRGLGFALAERFLQEGARVALLARDTDELERAKATLLETMPQAEILAVGCDVTEAVELEAAFLQVLNRFGLVDVLVNNAGSIAVGPFDTMNQADFDAQLDLQVHAALYAITLALPSFRRQGGGRVINISSIGGALPVPHMSTYCAAKFALAGLSETLAAELAPENIRVTTVYPGLMRTGSPIQAVFKGDHEKEYGWFAAGDVMPGLSVSAATAARHIVEGSRHGDVQVRFPLITHIGIIGHTVLPETYGLIMRQAARWMPKGMSRIRKTGAESQAWLERQLWYKPLQGLESAAERHLNQSEKFDAEYNLGLEPVIGA